MRLPTSTSTCPGTPDSALSALIQRELVVVGDMRTVDDTHLKDKENRTLEDKENRTIEDKEVAVKQEAIDALWDKTSTVNGDMVNDKDVTVIDPIAGSRLDDVIIGEELVAFRKLKKGAPLLPKNSSFLKAIKNVTGMEVSPLTMSVGDLRKFCSRYVNYTSPIILLP